MPVRKPKTYADTLEALRTERKAIADYKAKQEARTRVRDELIAHAASFPEAKSGIISKAAGVVPSRVSQIAPVKKSRLQSAVSTARAMDNAPSTVTAARRAGVIGSATEIVRTPKPDPLAAALAAAVGTPDRPELSGIAKAVAELPRPAERTARELPGIGDMPVTIQHGAASVRKWTPHRTRLTMVLNCDGRAYGKGRGFRLDVRDGSAYAILAALPTAVERVIICGPRPWHTDAETTATDDVRAWLTAPLPEGWSHDRHYPHHENPVARFVYRPTEGRQRRVEILHVGSWDGGCTVDDPGTVWHAFRLLLEAIQQRWADKKLDLLGSPKQTGMDLWQRTIPQNGEYPLMSTELRELIRTTSGQGRFELFPAHDADGGRAKLGGLYQYDCTFAYAGLLWGMPTGAPTHITRRAFDGGTAQTQEAQMRARSRWHVRVTVPADWSHVGLLPCSGLNGWEYPAEPGRTFTTWASGAEVWLARGQGWHIEVLDGITWEEGKPLNLWRDKLVQIWDSLRAWGMAAGEGYREAAQLAAKMVRSIVLFTVGGFHSRGTAKRGVTTDETLIPATARRAAEHDGVWEWEGAKQDAGALTAHPEWSAEVYGRMRARLLSGPNGTGALSVARHQVIAFRSDALWLTTDTGWANPASTPGRFRLKGSLSDVLAPTSESELVALRDAAEAGR